MLTSKSTRRILHENERTTVLEQGSTEVGHQDGGRRDESGEAGCDAVMIAMLPGQMFLTVRKSCWTEMTPASVPCAMCTSSQVYHGVYRSLIV